MPGYCFIKDSIYSEFTFELSARTGEDLIQNKYADYTVLFGYKDAQNYNALVLKTTTSQLINVSNGQSTYLSYISQKGIPDEKYHKLRLTFEKSQLTVFIDDSLFVSSNSSRLLSEGKIGFGSDKCAVYFDDILVKQALTYLKEKSSDCSTPNLELNANYPNPFNSETKISFKLPQTEKVTLEIYDIRGKKVHTLENRIMHKGNHIITWSALDDGGKPVPSGIYFARLRQGFKEKVVKMYLVK